MSKEIFYYYENLSSMCGQVIYVLKHVERYEDKCLFVHDEILDKHGDENTWSHERQWKRSSVIFDLFEDKRKQLDPTLFKGIAFEWIRGCFVIEGWNFWKRFKMMRFVFRTVGTINVFKYNWYVIIQYVFKSMVPNSLYLKLKKRIKVKYMKKKSKEAQYIG